ncbi:hypothetical protein JCM18382A_43280 [Bradyrhizobium sp. 17-4]|jgi:hypothetical protein|uniref:Uncharacterized protein n=1 Tax=Chiloscyllium punctatum TaxID=137246 RepID=A0A401TX34_CHIPU|nr:hypothetical protein [Chiloscyllium punctatum]
MAMRAMPSITTPKQAGITPSTTANTNNKFQYCVSGFRRPRKGAAFSLGWVTAALKHDPEKCEAIFRKDHA